jgi:hypothetical protein
MRLILDHYFKWFLKTGSRLVLNFKIYLKTLTFIINFQPAKFSQAKTQAKKSLREGLGLIWELKE